jgi:chemotaxis protein MotB
MATAIDCCLTGSLGAPARRTVRPARFLVPSPSTTIRRGGIMNRRMFVYPTLLCLASIGCVTEDTYKAQLAKYEALQARCQDSQDELVKEQKRNEELSNDLQAALGKADAAGGESADLKKALAEYRARAEAMDRIKERLALLQSKLQALTNLGLDVTIRRNRPIISLPGDVLFDSGKDELRDGGKDILEKVSAVMRADTALAGRYYQVAGHTDAEALRGQVKDKFYDNWGLSLMRARRVLAFMISARGGKLKPTRWSASGYGASDPVASNRSPDGKAKNRRVELVFLPDVGEMIDLQSLVAETKVDEQLTTDELEAN